MFRGPPTVTLVFNENMFCRNNYLVPAGTKILDYKEADYLVDLDVDGIILKL